MSYCKKCGSKISENSKFCGSCGHKISKSKEKGANIKNQGHSHITTSEKSPPDNIPNNKRSISPVLIFMLGLVIIVGIFILFKVFDRKPALDVAKDAPDNELFFEEEIAVAEEGGDIDLIVDPDEEANAFAEDDNKLRDELSFVEADDDDEFNDGLFNLGLQTKSDLIGRVMRHLRNNNLMGELNGAVYVPDGSIDRVGYMSYGESEYDFYLEVYQFENKQAVQTSLNEGLLSNLKAKGEIYTNDCIALFITSEYLDFGTNTEATRNKIIESFKSFKDGALSNVNNTNEFTYETYKNNRGYQIDYPSFLKISTSPENSDGTNFISPDGETELVVWSSYYAETDDPITERYESDLIDEDLNITYKVKKSSWYIISGFTNAGKIFYKKVFKSEVGAGTVTMYLEYPENEKERYNSILPHIVKSFKDI